MAQCFFLGGESFCHHTETTNEVAIVTNNINNLLGKIPWMVPAELIGGETNYVLKFEVVDSLSLTNSRIFWYNKFTILPEPGIVFSFLFPVSNMFCSWIHRLLKIRRMLGRGLRRLLKYLLFESLRES